MSKKVPPGDWHLERAGDYDQSGSWVVRVGGVRVGYVSPVLRGFGRPRRWQASVGGVPVGSPMRTRQLAVAVVVETHRRDHR